MIRSVFHFFLAFSAPRIKRDVPLVSLRVSELPAVKWCKDSAFQLTPVQTQLNGMNSLQVGQLFNHYNLERIASTLERGNITGFDLQRRDAAALLDLGLSAPQFTILDGLRMHWSTNGLPEDFIEKNLVQTSCLEKPFEVEGKLLEESFQVIRQAPYTSSSAHQSMNLLQKAARRNSSLAMAYLSWIHFQKELHVLPCDVAEAQALAAQSLPWLQSASAQHDPFAQCMLGEFHHLGNGVNQSHEEAARYYQLAADQGHAEGQFLLARAYLSGQGVSRNSTRAYELYALAAEQGHVLSNFRAGLCHKYSWGVEEPKATSETERWRWTEEELEDKEEEDEEEKEEHKIVVSENSTWIEDTWVRCRKATTTSKSRTHFHFSAPPQIVDTWRPQLLQPKSCPA